MANAYLVACHDYLTEQLDQAKRDHQAAQARGDAPQVRFLEGVIEELSDIRRFLSEHYDLSTQCYY